MLRNHTLYTENPQRAKPITSGNWGAADGKEKRVKTRKIPLKLFEKHFDS